MNSIEQSIQGESKSTAGDKHDTTRELMQQERNKAAQNLSNQILAQKTLIQLLNSSSSERVGFGSLIETDKGIIFIGLALGKVLCGQAEVVSTPFNIKFKRSYNKKSEDTSSLFLI